MSIEIGGFFGFVLLALDIWAIVSVLSSQTSTTAKVGWIFAIIILPLLGFIAWFFLGPRSLDQDIE
ncbi:MAG: PLD nuclease N-terminal domain-containing protein [Pseudomonadales bacterium]|nr:PLD nuclease N-terminal domain-containing protein [Pseudomonadales bacterium]